MTDMSLSGLLGNCHHFTGVAGQPSTEIDLLAHHAPIGAIKN
ncbi:hypothetical protein [uncultured Bradyrhizobium sp.]|nr:hypothetical protein [uncultured Bradyrhizobium sp.]